MASRKNIQKIKAGALRSAAPAVLRKQGSRTVKSMSQAAKNAAGNLRIAGRSEVPVTAAVKVKRSIRKEELRQFQRNSMPVLQERPEKIQSEVREGPSEIKGVRRADEAAQHIKGSRTDKSMLQAAKEPAGDLRIAGRSEVPATAAAKVRKSIGKSQADRPEAKIIRKEETRPVLQEQPEKVQSGVREGSAGMKEVRRADNAALHIKGSRTDKSMLQAAKEPAGDLRIADRPEIQVTAAAKVRKSIGKSQADRPEAKTIRKEEPRQFQQKRDSVQQKTDALHLDRQPEQNPYGRANQRTCSSENVRMGESSGQQRRPPAATSRSQLVRISKQKTAGMVRAGGRKVLHMAIDAMDTADLKVSEGIRGTEAVVGAGESVVKSSVRAVSFAAEIRKIQQARRGVSAVKAASATGVKTAEAAAKAAESTVRIASTAAGGPISLALTASGFVLAPFKRLGQGMASMARNGLTGDMLTGSLQKHFTASSGNAVSESLGMLSGLCGWLTGGLGMLVGMLMFGLLLFIVSIGSVISSPVRFALLSAEELLQLQDEGAPLSDYHKEYDEYIAGMQAEIQTYADQEYRVVIQDHEGSGVPDNYRDIMAVYSSTGAGMSEPGWEDLISEMCTYNVYFPEEGEEGVVTVIYMTMDDYFAVHPPSDDVRVLAESAYETMRTMDHFGQESPGFPEDHEEYLKNLPNIGGTAGAAISSAYAKLGTPYSQQYRDSGSYYDCSSFTYYSYLSAGVSLAYGGANTAAAQGQYCQEYGHIVSPAELQPGDLLFYSHVVNGRFMNISHVEIYLGEGFIIDCTENSGVAIREFKTDDLVLCGRPY